MVLNTQNATDSTCSLKLKFHLLPILSNCLLYLGQVFQRIDIVSKDFDNIVELQLGTPWPLPRLEVTATLAHKFELIGWFFSNLIFYF